MDNILNTLQDIKDFVETRQCSATMIDEKSYHQTAHSISSKINKHIFFNGSGTAKDSKADSTSAGKESFQSHTHQSSGTFGQVSIKTISEYLEILYKRFKTELNFLIVNANSIAKLKYESTVNKPDLNAIKNILNFESFTLHYKKDNPHFYRAEAITDRFKIMVDTLDEAQKCLNKEDFSKTIPFVEESECQNYFMQYFSSNLFESEYFLKVCSELWRSMRNKISPKPTELSTQIVFDNLKLYLHAISFPTSNPEDYPLHKAVYSSNLTMIRRICAREKSPVFHADIEQSDPFGVTPLMLSVLLGNKDAALILANHGANPKHRSYLYSRTPLEEAIFRKNRAMIKILLSASIYRKQEQWEENKLHLIDFLRKVPDFSFEMSWECDSKIIPFVKKVAPSDTYKVYKSGSSIRIDLSLLGWSKLKSVRGNSSIIFNGLGSGEGKLLMVDHIKKIAVDVLGDMSSLALENKVDELIKHEKMNSEVRAENVVFKPATNWKGDIVKSNINGYDCTKSIAKGTFSVLFTKRNIQVEVDTSHFKTFEEYFEHIILQPLWILEDGSGRIIWNQSPLVKVNYFMEYYQAIVKTLFEKDGKENINEAAALSMKGKREVEKMNIAQKKLLKNYTKNIVATIYMCDNFPLNMDHFLPILDILSNVSPHIGRLKGFLERTLSINKSSFPIKAYIPIFFSLNAILSMKDFKFTTVETHLFDLGTMVQRRQKQLQSSYVFREERYKTEGGSDDENAQERWQELMKHEDSEDEVISYAPTKFEYKEDISDIEEEEEPLETVQQTEKLIESLFDRSKQMTENQDLVNVYIPEEDEEDYEGENLDDFEISEKYRNETLKVSSHGTTVPKTFISLQEKFRSPFTTSRSETGFTQGVKGPANINMQSALQQKYKEPPSNLDRNKTYKFMGKLNPQGSMTERHAVKAIRSRKESLSSRNFNEVDFSENVKDLQMRKLLKYTTTKKNLLSRLNFPIPKMANQEKRAPTPSFVKAKNEQQQQKSSKKIKHERVKSFDLPEKPKVESLFGSLAQFPQN